MTMRLKKRAYIASVVLVALLTASAMPAQAATLSMSWSDAADWDNSTSENSVVHASVSNTDYDNASNVRLGYDPSDPLYGSDLVAYYPLQEDSGGTAYDFSGNGYDGSTSGGVTQNATGLLETSSYSLDGADDYINYGDQNISSQITISFWTYIRGYGGSASSKRFVDLGMYGGNNQGASIEYNNNDNAIVGKIGDGSSDYSVSMPEPTHNSWVLMSMTYDSSGDLELYLNGSQVSSSNIGDGSLADSSRTWTAATTAFDLGSGNIDGKFADLRIYNRALSPDELSQRYNITKGYLRTDTKSFSSPVEPDLDTDVTLNNQTIDITVVGSPSGTSESHTISLNGSGSYDIPWSFAHSNYQINASMSTSNISITPILSSVELVGTTIENAYNITGTVSASGSPISDATVEAINQSSGSAVAAATTNASSPNYHLEVPNATYTIKTYKKGYQDSTTTTTVDGSNVPGVDLTLTGNAPTLNDSSASPQGGSETGAQTTLSIDVDDADFSSTGGDEVKVEFYGNGDLIGSDNLTSSGTASISWMPSEAGTNNWYARAVDARGREDISSTFEISRKPFLKFFNESSDSLITHEVTAEIRSEDSSYENTLNTTDGTIELNNTPDGETLRVLANSSEYVDKSFILTNYSRDYNVIMLPVTDTTASRYSQSFNLEDATDQYPPESTIIEIQTSVNGSKVGISGNGRFGPNNLVDFYLVDEKFYQIKLRNADGDIVRYGSYTAIDDGNVEVIELGSSINSQIDINDKVYAFDSKLNKQESQIEIDYVDRSNETSKITYDIIKENDSGNFTVSSASDTLSGTTYRSVTKVDNPESTYRVDYQLDRSSGTISDDTYVGGIPSLANDFPIDQGWLTWIGYLGIIAVGGLLVPWKPRLSALSMVIVGFVFNMIGLLSIPVILLELAGVTSLLFLVAGDREVGY